MDEHAELDVIPYKKKSKTKPPKKAKHKHIYEPCVLEFNDVRFDKERGFVYDRPGVRISAYCPVCGKLGPIENMERWYEHASVGGTFIVGMTEECERELNQETRTLPTFWVDDQYFQKFVEV